MVDKTKAFISGIFLELGVGSPATFTRICDATGVSGIGVTNTEEDSTTLCSNGVREYIAGVSEGSQITIDNNYIISSAVRRQLMAAVTAKATVHLRLVVDPENDGDFDEEYYFDAAALSYALTPNAAAKNTMAFTLRISGAIQYVDHYVP